MAAPDNSFYKSGDAIELRQSSWVLAFPIRISLVVYNSR